MKLLPLVIALLNGSARERLTGWTATARSLAVVGVLAGISSVFLVVALTIVLAAQVGVVFACLIMSALFALAAVFMFVHYGRMRRRRQVAQVEQVALASSAETPVGAGAALLIQAFVRGFLNRNPP